MLQTDRLLLRPVEAGEALGLSRSKTYALIASGELPSVSVGGCVRVPVAALQEWIAKQLRVSA
jgi:excisionase family DNA binding protein